MISMNRPKMESRPYEVLLHRENRQLTIMSLINCKKKIKKEFLSFHALIFPNNNLQFSQRISCMSFVMYSLKYFTLLLIQMHFL